MATPTGPLCWPPEEKLEGKKTKISGGQGKDNKKGENRAGEAGGQKINRRNYVQERRGGLGWYQ